MVWQACERNSSLNRKRAMKAGGAGAGPELDGVFCQWSDSVRVKLME